MYFLKITHFLVVNIFTLYNITGVFSESVSILSAKASFNKSQVLTIFWNNPELSSECLCEQDVKVGSPDENYCEPLLHSADTYVSASSVLVHAIRSRHLEGSCRSL